MAVQKGLPQELVVITPEVQMMANQTTKLRRLVDSFDKLNIEEAEYIPLSNSVNSHLCSPKQPTEYSRQATVSIQYRTKLPQPSNSLAEQQTSRLQSRVGHAAVPLVSTTPVLRNSLNPSTKVPAILIAKLLTTQGYGSHYPQLFPNFRDATLLPTHRQQTEAQDFSDYTFLKSRLGLQTNPPSPFANRVVANNIINNRMRSNTPIDSTMTANNVGGTYSVVFPKRYKRKSWRRNARL